MAFQHQKNQAVLTFKSFSKAKTKAEVLCTLECVTSAFSNNSSQDIFILFKHMFSDTEIAEDFKMGRPKLMYINNFGLVSYVKEYL